MHASPHTLNPSMMRIFALYTGDKSVAAEESVDTETATGVSGTR